MYNFDDRYKGFNIYTLIFTHLCDTMKDILIKMVLSSQKRNNESRLSWAEKTFFTIYGC